MSNDGRHSRGELAGRVALVTGAIWPFSDRDSSMRTGCHSTAQRHEQSRYAVLN